MIDTYTKAVLTVIAMALIVPVCRPLFEPGAVQAQGPTEVKVVGWSVSQISVAASVSGTIPVRLEQQQPLEVRCMSGCGWR
jgi:hypothetical protein